MTLEHDAKSLSRRALLRGAALGAVSLALPSRARARAQQAVAPAPYGPFRMGMQSYSLRGYPVDEALAKTQALGLTYWEAYPDHLPLTDDPKVIAAYKEKLKAHGIRLVTYGVVGFRKDEADARRTFAFAQAMGIRTLSADPDPDALSLLDRLCEEYRINIGIHNHGPDDRWGKWEVILAAIQGHSPRIGACDDTGHYLLANEDPVTAADKFGKRLYGVHLKDVKEGPGGVKSFTEIGKGKLDVVLLLKSLLESQYPPRGILSLEYEEHEDNPIPYLEECLAATRRYVQTAIGNVR